MTRRGILLFAAMAVIWGIPYLFIRVAVEHVTPPVLVFGRTAVGAVVLLPIALARSERRTPRTFAHPRCRIHAQVPRASRPPRPRPAHAFVLSDDSGYKEPVPMTPC